jgi:hypothetical protein
MPELNITSPYVHTRVDSNTFTLRNPMPQSTSSPSQGLWIWPLDSWPSTQRKTTLICCRWNRFQHYPPAANIATLTTFLFTPCVQIEVVLIRYLWRGLCILYSQFQRQKKPPKLPKILPYIILFLNADVTLFLNPYFFVFIYIFFLLFYLNSLFDVLSTGHSSYALIAMQCFFLAV